MNEKPRIYLESGVFNALWNGEANSARMGRDILHDGQSGRIEIVVSALVMVECEVFAHETGADWVAEFFESDWIIRCNVDPFVAEEARRLRGVLGGLSPHAYLHLATARLEKCDFFFAHDKRLLKLNGQSALAPLQIAAPFRPWDAGQMSLEDIAGVMPETGWARRSLVI